MNRNERQILVNPHSSIEKVPVGALNLGEIAVQHNNVEDAALYIETVADSESAETVAKFITEKAVDAHIDSAISVVQMEIDGINEAVGLPHDPEMWDSGMTVWDAIEHTYQEMTAGTAAANTKLELVGGKDDYLDLTSEKDDATSSITYYLASKGIDARVDSAVSIVNESINELLERVESFSSSTVERFENVETLVEQLSAATGDALEDLDERLEEIEDEITANEVSSLDGSIVVTPTTGGTDLSVNLDGKTIVLNDNNELVADLKLTSVTPSDANVREEYALVGHDGTQLGETVKIYKDSSLYDVYLGHVDDELDDPEDPESVIPGSGDTALCFIYETNNGTYQLVAVNVEDFLQESEFADGLAVSGHVVSVKVDEDSEEVEIASGVTAPVLSVSEDGLKIQNIQNAINYAVELLAHNIDADVTGLDDHVAVEVVQTDTEITNVIVTTNDIASEEELNTVETSVGLGPNGEFIAPEGYASGATSVVDGLKAISQALEEVSEKLNAASVVETGSTENWVSLTVEELEPGKTGITLDDSALAEELIDIREDIAAETSARENADLELLGSSASTSGETSIMGLKNLIETVTNNLNTNAVQAAEFGEVATKDASDYGSNAGLAVVDNDGGDGQKIVLDLSELKVDCGEY